MRPVSPKVGMGDFTPPAGQRLNAINLVAGTLNFAAAFSIAAASSGASITPSHDRLGRFRFLGHAGEYRP